MGTTTKHEEKEDKELMTFVSENYHKVRECKMYEMEYNECKSLKGRFQQYYVYGETLDCSKWKEDLYNCNKFFNSREINYKLAASIIHHENERLEKRMKAHQANDVWEKRRRPPADWNCKLPEWLEKRQENAFREKSSVEGQVCVIS